MRQYELDSKAKPYSHCFGTVLPASDTVLSYLSKVSWLFPCSSKSFLNFKLSGTRLLIIGFL